MEKQRISWSVKLAIMALVAFCTFPQISRGQNLYMYTTPPVIDSFPIVKIGIAVTDSGKSAAKLIPGDFAATEDGIGMAPIQLLNCSGYGSAAVAIVSDISSSIYGSAGGGNFSAYFNGYSQLLSVFQPPSEIAFIGFTDSVVEYNPGIRRPSGFYLADNNADTTEFMDSIRALQFGGNTNIDTALFFAAKLLGTAAIPRKAIVLITDDAVRNAPYMYNVLSQAGIALFVIELTKDTVWQNEGLALALGGDYHNCYDTTADDSVFTQVGESILGEFCTLRYVSTTACPWEHSHSVNVVLKYGGQTTSAHLSYALGSNKIDTIPPNESIDTPLFISRLVHATDVFPCLPGLENFTDSALTNFAKLREIRGMPDSSYDSLVVIDTMYPASGWYLAKDSLGNERRIHVTYLPKPDTIAPQMALPTYSSGAYIENITEQRPWDRGVEFVQMQAGGVNLVFDSAQFFGSSFVRAHLHIVNIQDSASGCLEAIDSAGNKNVYCYQWNGEGGDTLPPQFVQDPLAEPRVLLSGKVTEMRTGDVGIKSVTLTPVSNTSNLAVTYLSKSLATVSVTLNDSLYAGSSAVEALDSAGNRVRDTLRYTPLPDMLAPQLLVTNPTGTTFLVSAAEIRPWDRGIASLTASALTNMTAGIPVFADADHASILLTVANSGQAGVATIRATDSAGNVAIQTINYGGVAILSPLQVKSPLDFGTIPAPGSVTLPLVVTNPNTVPVTLTQVTTTGDDSVFSWNDALPLTIGAGQSASLGFTFHPLLIGYWSGQLSIGNDTMTLLNVALTGNSTGTLHLSLDTIHLARGGDNGSLVVRMDATPKPINLDTVAFTIISDNDIAEPGIMTLSCGNIDTGLCNYTVKATQNADGSYSYLLSRNSKALSPWLAFESDTFSIPVRSFVGPRTSTPFSFSQTYAGAFCSVIADSGLVTMGSICADTTLRAELNNQLAVYLQSVSPNPASSELRATIASAIDQQTISYELLDILGEYVKRGTCVVAKGLTTNAIDLATVRPGSYVFRLRVGESVCGSTEVIVAK